MRGICRRPCERAVRVDVRRAHEVGEHHAGRRVDDEERGHQLLAHDRVVGRVDRHALEVEVAAGEHAQRLPVVPRRVGRRVRHLDVCPVLPRDEAVRVVDQRDAERLGLRVRVKGRASVAEGEWLLDAHLVDVQRVIPRVGRAAVPVVRRAPELAINAVAFSVEHRLDVREADRRNVVERSELHRAPRRREVRLLARRSSGQLGARRVIGERLGDERVGLVEQADQVVVMHVGRDAEQGSLQEGQRHRHSCLLVCATLPPTEERQASLLAAVGDRADETPGEAGVTTS